MNAGSAPDPCSQCTAPLKVAPLPVSVTCVLTERCNQRCGVCGYPLRSEAPRDLPVSVLQGVLEELSVSPNTTVVLTGGEPTLHPEFERILELLLSFPGTVCLLTNGRPVPGSVATRFYSAPGPRMVVVSLYGRARIHEAVTAVTGSFEAAREGFRRWRLAAESCSRRAPEFPAIGMTLCSVNINEVPAVLEIAQAWGAPTVTIEPAYKPRFAAWDLTRATRLSVLEQDAVWATWAAQLGVKLIDLTPLLLVQPRCCIVPMRSVYIGAAGSVFPCIPAKGGFKDEDAGAVGNLTSQGLRTIWHAPAFAAFRRKAARRSFPFCADCLPRHHVMTLTDGPCMDCSQVDEIVAPTVLPEQGNGSRLQPP